MTRCLRLRRLHVSRYTSGADQKYAPRRWLPAGRTPDVPGKHPGRSVAEVTQQHAGSVAIQKAKSLGACSQNSSLADPDEQLIDHRLALRSHPRQCLPAVVVVAHMASPVQLMPVRKSRPRLVRCRRPV
jgi:hypothetical protein